MAKKDHKTHARSAKKAARKARRKTGGGNTSFPFGANVSSGGGGGGRKGSHGGTMGGS